ncbi:MAG TPA: TIGR02281 family clan AA aspartic protease [Methyloceanibacter sp.]|nr:TIGR02281 family clan AA aspartic protease [Methyloceanibacter sp.]
MNFPAISSLCAAEVAQIRTFPEKTMGSAARHLLREALVWSGIALGIFALIYFFDDLKATFDPAPNAASVTSQESEPKDSPDGFAREVRLKADERGHFVFAADVNGRKATFMADTGATVVVLSYEDAARLGLSPQRLDFTGLAQTANGPARVAPVVLDRVRVRDITVRDVSAVVAEKGALATNLLGMSFLSRLKSFQVQDGELVLVQ